MPVEGQWDRVNTPVEPRDKRFIAIVGAIAAIALIVGILVYATRPKHSHAGCFTVTFASTVGGGIRTYCGASARRYCHTEAAISEGVADKCEALGYPTLRRAGG